MIPPFTFLGGHLIQCFMFNNSAQERFPMSPQTNALLSQSIPWPCHAPLQVKACLTIWHFVGVLSLVSLPPQDCELPEGRDFICLVPWEHLEQYSVCSRPLADIYWMNGLFPPLLYSCSMIFSIRIKFEKYPRFCIDQPSNRHIADIWLTSAEELKFNIIFTRHINCLEFKFSQYLFEHLKYWCIHLFIYLPEHRQYINTKIREYHPLTSRISQSPEEEKWTSSWGLCQRAPFL